MFSGVNVTIPKSLLIEPPIRQVRWYNRMCPSFLTKKILGSFWIHLIFMIGLAAFLITLGWVLMIGVCNLIAQAGFSSHSLNARCLVAKLFLQQRGERTAATECLIFVKKLNVVEQDRNESPLSESQPLQETQNPTDSYPWSTEDVLDSPNNTSSLSSKIRTGIRLNQSELNAALHSFSSSSRSKSARLDKEEEGRVTYWNRTHMMLATLNRRKRQSPSLGLREQCCPSVSEFIQPKGGLSQEGRILELYGNGQTVAQSIFQSSCREDVRDKPCRFLDKKVRHHSICAQKYSYSYALVREFGNPEGSPWRLDFIRVRSGCVCELRI